MQLNTASSPMQDVRYVCVSALLITRSLSAWKRQAGRRLLFRGAGYSEPRSCFGTPESERGAHPSQREAPARVREAPARVRERRPPSLNTNASIKFPSEVKQNSLLLPLLASSSLATRPPECFQVTCHIPDLAGEAPTV